MLYCNKPDRTNATPRQHTADSQEQSHLRRFNDRLSPRAREARTGGYMKDSELWIRPGLQDPHQILFCLHLSSWEDRERHTILGKHSCRHQSDNWDCSFLQAVIFGYAGTCCRACRSSRVCCAASRRLAWPAEVSRPTRVCRSGSSREEPSGNSTSSSTSIDCRRRRAWRHTSQSPSVKMKNMLLVVLS